MWTPKYVGDNCFSLKYAKYAMHCISSIPMFEMFYFSITKYILIASFFQCPLVKTKMVSNLMTIVFPIIIDP